MSHVTSAVTEPFRSRWLRAVPHGFSPAEHHRGKTIILLLILQYSYTRCLSIVRIWPNDPVSRSVVESNEVHLPKYCIQVQILKNVNGTNLRYLQFTWVFPCCYFFSRTFFFLHFSYSTDLDYLNISSNKWGTITLLRFNSQTSQQFTE